MLALDRDDRLPRVVLADLPQHRRHVHVGRTGETARPQAVAQVITQKELQGGVPQAVDLFGLALDLHPLGG